MRARIVAEARSWLGTPYHQDGLGRGVRGVGADCVGFVAGVARALGLFTGELAHYGPLPDGTLLDRLGAYLVPVSDPKPADIVALRFDRVPHHVGLLSDYHAGGLGLIHCYLTSGGVVETCYDRTWQRRTVRVLRFPELVDG